MYNVLIADDEPRVCNGLKVIIDWEAFGFKVIDTAEDGKDALEKLKKNRYNLLVTDIRMPELNGLELIKAICIQNPLVRVLIISGYNDFEYAKKAIDAGVRGYLLKPVNRDELSQYVEKIRDELDREFKNSLKIREHNNIGRDKFQFDIAYGHLSKESISQKVKDYDMILNKHSFSVALIEIENFFDIVEKNLDDANLVKFSVRNIAEEIITENRHGYLYDDINGTLGIILCCDMSKLSKDMIHDCLQHICSSVSKYLEVNIIIGCGEFVDRVTDIKMSAKQAQIALKRRIGIGKSDIIPYSKVALDERGVLDLQWNKENLIAAIEVVDKNVIGIEVSQLISEINQKCFSKEVIRGIVYNIIWDICTIVKSFNGDARELFDEENINTIIVDFENIMKLKEWLMSVCIKACRYILELQESKGSNVFNQIKKYIDNYYYKDLSIKSLAEIFYMSPAYLGRIFKNNMGESYNDYLNKVRIAEVKRRLFQGDSKIYDIIAGVGYSNHEHFYRQFKRYEGKSFAKYKEDIKRQIR